MSQTIKCQRCSHVWEDNMAEPIKCSNCGTLVKMKSKKKQKGAKPIVIMDASDAKNEFIEALQIWGRLDAEVYGPVGTRDIAWTNAVRATQAQWNINVLNTGLRCSAAELFEVKDLAEKHLGELGFGPYDVITALQMILEHQKGLLAGKKRKEPKNDGLQATSKNPNQNKKGKHSKSQ